MESDGAAFARAADAYCGVPFRLRGRDPVTGIDCIGLVHLALRDIGRTPPTLPAYSLRQAHIDGLLALLAPAGFTATSRSTAAGDLLLMQPGPGQFHLAIALDATRIVHAHAGLRRVVRTALTDTDRVTGRWRLS
ncbi:NlpC/P60 family protein [Aurantiacibacter aquimixticola]|uniref:NlpC/P60 domain-containing protein n=1 Tax=Aurantiacibacter aquimixticola TaxID=1958945 RepID=A0A419RV65_9SPHN|nr:NlpC/P60 family protein [Aurantiacibacter aquimixticola]RJY09683.1 hypothetical protein D6201_10255 [Aurantiacibacter aquimixticola]